MDKMNPRREITYVDRPVNVATSRTVHLDALLPRFVEPPNGADKGPSAKGPRTRTVVTLQVKRIESNLGHGRGKGRGTHNLDAFGHLSET